MAARVHPASEGSSENGARRFARHNAWSISPVHENKSVGDLTSERQTPSPDEISSVPLSQRIIFYFQWLSQHPQINIDFDYLSELITDRADITAHDEFTEATIFHEIASQWDIKVAEFVLVNGGEIDGVDNEGRTPLHIAAYCNHTDMIEFLLDNGAKLDAKSNDEQNVVHYAVRGSAIQALELLIGKGACYDSTKGKPCVDIRGRTPLQLGAELDRTEAVLFLLSLDSTHPARCDVCDKSGHPALVSMITNMPQMAQLGMDQFHTIFASERRQEYLLSRIESQAYSTKSPFEATVEHRVIPVLTHPVMRKLIEQKWKRLARWYFFIFFVLYILFLVTWTILIVYPPIQQKHLYTFPEDTWRVVLGVFAVMLLMQQIFEEFFEYFFSYSKSKRHKSWMRERLRDDLSHCNGADFHEERQFIIQKLNDTSKLTAKYFKDAWNYIDMSCYILLILVITLHIIDITSHSQQLALWNARVASLALIIIWIRLLEFARASEFLGPMIAIIGQLSGNIIQYFIVFAVFYFPYVANFWLLFGGDEQTAANITEPSEELTSVHRIFTMLFRMSLIDDYPYQEIRAVDELSATFLIISFILISALIGLNLFIALLSDTFQRVYDNAYANAELQKAQLIMSLEEKATRRSRRNFSQFIRWQCNPISDYYDDDEEASGGKTTSIQKITHQTYKVVSDLLSKSEDSNDRHTRELQVAVEGLSEQIKFINSQLQEIKILIGSSTSGQTRLPPMGSREPLSMPGTGEGTLDSLPSLPSIRAACIAKYQSQNRRYSKAPSVPYQSQTSIYQGHRRRRMAYVTALNESDEDEDVPLLNTNNNNNNNNNNDDDDDIDNLSAVSTLDV